MIYRLLLVLLLVASCDSNGNSNGDKEPEPVFEIKSIAPLDSSLTESSGVITIDEKLYTHSDMAGLADLLELNTDGSIANTITYSNIRVKDWEDTAVDDKFIYIADIGNNLGNRTDLRIFKVALSNLINTNATAETISFSFSNQTDFGNSQYNQTSYDAEAMVVINGQIYIFTKDWLQLNTQVYQFENVEGTYPVAPINSLNIGGLVTGATTNPNGEIILCGYSPTLAPFVARLVLKDGVPTVDRKVDISGMLGSGSQIEGIAYFKTVDGVPVYYLTSEKFTRTIAGQQIEFPAALYELRWND
ncbi:hypothetical protein [Nonlabens marinus]|uniref:Gll0560 protein n=1 Tax=Nonlabens marinus S1-08 TaxID=1454201 RepID=W8VNK7_9FLAO|nr:hypothetical protein [Nonlabens marinus]BAO54519.1 gll0560 protein [Nonlabens marinus S1-08]